jgi:hypothetical protein
MDNPTPADEVVIQHRHQNAERPMAPVDDSRVDGLRVRQFSCDCGFGAAILSRNDPDEPGPSWPIRFGVRQQH